VEIDPRNITTKNVKKGPAIDKVLFSAPGYISRDDPWKPPAFSLSRKENRKRQIESGNEKPFKP
jgi:hypothetical protein